MHASPRHVSLRLVARLAVLVCLAGCEAAKPPAAPIPTAEATSVPAEAPGTTSGSKPEGTPPASADPVPAAEPAGPATPVITESGPLDLDGISFLQPAGWIRVSPPSSNILEAEFTLPKAEGDEYDGRLTIMAAGGGFDGNVGRWRGEFDGLGQEDMQTDTLTINGLEANRVDIRGVWKGPSFKPVPPREGYRLIAVILPTGAQSAYYVKVTGPLNTIAEHKPRIDSFVQSAQLKK
jgi:hypothetical protein